MNSSVRILVGVDGSLGSEAALRWALREASLRASTGTADTPPIVAALLAYSPDHLPGATRHTDPVEIEAAAREMLDRAVSRVADPVPPVRLTREIVPGRPIEVVTAAATAFDLLVVGERGHGAMHRLVAGSVSQGIVHHSPIPVVVVRAAHHASAPVSELAARPVVVGIDGSDLSVMALRWAAAAAAVRRAPLRVVHAWGGFDPLYAQALVGAQAALNKQAEDILRDALKAGLDGAPDLPVDSVVSPDSAIRALLREAKDAQLVVVGSRGLGGFARLMLGSVSDQCVLHAACDVTVIHAPVTADDATADDATAGDRPAEEAMSAAPAS